MVISKSLQDYFNTELAETLPHFPGHLYADITSDWIGYDTSPFVSVRISSDATGFRCMWQCSNDDR